MRDDTERESGPVDGAEEIEVVIDEDAPAVDQAVTNERVPPEPDEERDLDAAGEGVEEVQLTPEEVARLQREKQELRELYLRKLAEFDNFRKRTDREREELERTAGEGVVRDLLPVLDNFERALQHATGPDANGFYQGVEMIAKQLWDLLERRGLEMMDPAGEMFQPELHEAVQRVEDADDEPGTIVAVHAKGYLFGGRLMRPAMVAVAVPPAESSAGASGRVEEEGEVHSDADADLRPDAAEGEGDS